MLLHKMPMDDKDERKEEKEVPEEFKTEELDSPEDSAPQERQEEMTEETTEQPRKFFHSSESQPEIYAGQQKGGSRKKIYLVLVVLALLAIGAYLYSIRSGSTKPATSPTPAPVVQSTPTPSPTPSFDKSKHTIRVLNGTTTQGLAASTSAKLKDLGYQIERTANATNSAFTKTVVRVKPDLKELLSNLIKDLRPDFKGEEGSTLKDSDASDGEVILGED